MTKTGNISLGKMATSAGFSDDSKYLAPEMAKKEVMAILESLELDRHRLRIQLAMNGMDGDMKLQSGLTLNEAIKMANKRIGNVEEAFEEYLSEDQE